MLVLIEAIISQDPRLEVVAKYCNAEDAIANVEKVRPDVISMDILLPGMNGLEATSEILYLCPTPIVIISSSANTNAVGTSMEALKRGALSVLGKPGMPGTVEFDREAKRMTNQLYHMSQVKVMRQFAHRRQSRFTAPAPAAGAASRERPRMPRPTLHCSILAIGASTGGPPALERFFNALRADSTLAILLVQHISPGFTEGLVEWLNSVAPFRFVLAENEMAPEKGHVYVAPDQHHLTIESGCIRLVKRRVTEKHCPSVDVLFSSVAKHYGSRAAGLLLTGMGADGAQGLLEMRMRGAWTATQSEESCVVYGMPRAAVAKDASCAELNPVEMADILNCIKNHE